MSNSGPTAIYKPSSELLNQLRSDSEAALESGEVVFDEASQAILQQRWQRAGDVGLRFRLQRPAVPAKPTLRTRYTLRVESATERGRSLIQPEAGDERYSLLMPYALFVYTRGKGIVFEPEGSIARTLRIFGQSENPYQTYYEALPEYLGYAKYGWEEIR